MPANTFVKQTQVWQDGHVSISVYKQKLRPDGSIKSQKVHRIGIGPGEDVAHAIEANNVGLKHMGFPAIDPAEIDLPLELRRVALDTKAPKKALRNPIRTVEINSGGGMRLAVHPHVDIDGEIEEDEDPEYIVIGPFDDVAEKVAQHNRLMGPDILPVTDDHLHLAHAMRKKAHAHPRVRERMAIEAKILADKKLADEAREKKVQEYREKVAAEEAAKVAELAAKEQERIAAEEARIAEMMKAHAAEEVAKALAQSETMKAHDAAIAAVKAASKQRDDENKAADDKQAAAEKQAAEAARKQ